MKEYQSLSHTRWDCKYHVVFIPKRRKKRIFGVLRRQLGEIFHELARHKESKIVEGHLMREILALSGELGRLRDIGMSLRPGVPEVHFSRLMTRLRVSFRINESAGVASGVTLFTLIPEASVTQTAPLTVTVRAAMNTASELAWDFGDDTPILRTVRSGNPPKIAPAEGTHVYAKPGRYVIKLRSVQNDSLSEFRISVVVSRNQKLGDPLIIHMNRVTFDTAAKTITFITGGAVQQARRRILWRVGDLTNGRRQYRNLLAETGTLHLGLRGGA